MRASLASLGLLAALAALAAAPVRAQSPAPLQVWAEHPVGAVDVGWDPASSATIRAGTFLSVVGPAIDDEWAARAVRTCATTIGGLSESASLKIENAKTVESALVDLVKAGQDTVSVAQFNQERKRRSDAIGAEFAAAVDEKRSNLLACMPASYRDAGFQIGVVVRTCPAVPARNHPCATLRQMAPEAAARRARAFVNLVETMQAKGAAATGTIYAVVGPGLKVPTLAALPDPALWREPTTAEAIASFERLASRVRELNELPQNLAKPITISYAVPRVIGLTQETAARVLDILASPSEALRPLGRGVQALATLSDEVARTRILDCTRMRGLSKLDDISACAGYKLDTATVAACMNRQRCLPAIEAKAWASLVAINDAMDLRQLAASSTLARMQQGWRDVAAWESAARQCAAQADAAAGSDEEAYRREAGLCLVRSGLQGDRERALYACVTAGRRSPADLMECAVAASGGTLGEAYACWKQSGNSPTDLALCGASGKVDPRVLACVQAYRKGSAESAALSCVSGALPAEHARIAACIAENRSNRQAAAICAVSPALSPKEAAALKCAQEHAGDWGAVAGCAAAPYIANMAGGDLGRAIQCGLQSAGDPMGTAVCYAAGDLNPTMQVMLQCAAVSPDLLTFGTCAGGQLAFKEFTQCREVRFAEGKCFGKNNEIRRFIRNLGLGDISDDTMVAQAYNLQLEVLKFQVALAEDSLKVLGKVGEQVLSAGSNITREIGRGVGNVAREGRRFIRRLCKWC